MVGPAPTTSFEMDELTSQNAPVPEDTLLGKDTNDGNLLKEFPIQFLTPSSVWGASDEDSQVITGLQYTTEPSEMFRNLSNVILGVKNAPTGSSITVDILKETAPNSNVFGTLFSTLPVIDINEFTSQTSVITPTFSDATWESQRRLQLVVTINDSNGAATGLKVSLG